MEVFSLIGPSGTGKSHHASMLALELKIPVIIDDGLLIKGNHTLAGRSAKRERSRFSAVKRAILHNPEHAQAIKEKIDNLNPDKILILGTSERMVEKIMERLGITAQQNTIEINEIATPAEIQKALEIRKQSNRHVIPLPTFAIKKDFPGYLVLPIRALFKKNTAKKPVMLERTIVRPVYSSYGNFYIAEQVITDLVRYISRDVCGIAHIRTVKIFTADHSNISLNVEVSLYHSKKIIKTILSLQKKLKNLLEYLTGFYFSEVNIVAHKIIFREH